MESDVGHAQNKFKGLRFESPEEAQAYIDRWETNWADTRIHGTTKRQVRLMFEEEKPNLFPLPVVPFRYYEYGMRTVHLDGAVEVAGAFYHVPPGLIGRRLHVQWDALHVRILCPKTGELFREHVQVPTYQFVRRYLDRQPQLPMTLKQVDPLIRELTQYRDLIDRRLEGEAHEHD